MQCWLGRLTGWCRGRHSAGGGGGVQRAGRRGVPGGGGHGRLPVWYRRQHTPWSGLTDALHAAAAGSVAAVWDHITALFLYLFVALSVRCAACCVVPAPSSRDAMQPAVYLRCRWQLCEHTRADFVLTLLATLSLFVGLVIAVGAVWLDGHAWLCICNAVVAVVQIMALVTAVSAVSVCYLIA